MTKPKPKTGEIVFSALKKLMKNTGWTCRTIIKFIKLEYKISDPRINRKVSRALKHGVRMGLLQMENGRYRLANNMSKSLTNCRAPIQKKRRCACVLRRQNSRLRDYRKN
ncbi:hypothetical protein RR48_15001 [Papilio machaon]|uniref:H15 domain-containing protein n=1 Tax=Papilio machaon TaxID=76193 RepID=A0A194R0Y3_PAPMA|nr:hypothetical protein RR48_15001 [Papilio machaon]